MDTLSTPHKIKAEWTRSSTNEESHLQAHRDKQKIKIIEQIVLRPGNDKKLDVHPKDVDKSKKARSKKTEENKSKKCQICEKCYPKSEFEEHVKSHSHFECTEPDCSKKFKRKSSLRKHLYTHNGKFKYVCEDCKETFIDKCKYQVHIASKHKIIVQVYECKECKKTFNSADYLRRHQITHKDEFPYPCTMCDQKFKWLTSLQAHNMIHTQNKTIVQCKECFKRFFTQRTLDRHMKIHQNTKYHCTKCSSVVSIRKDNIMRHIRHLHNDIPRAEISKYISVVEEVSSSHVVEKVKDVDPQDEIEITDDDESNVLIIDETVVTDEVELKTVVDVPTPVINNRVNVIQSIGNPNKNQQQTPQNTASTEIPITNNEKTDETATKHLQNDNESNQLNNNNNDQEKVDTEIQLPPKKKAIAKYNPIEHYRKILGLSETNTSSKKSEEAASEVFPDHWRKRTSQNFLFRR